MARRRRSSVLLSSLLVLSPSATLGQQTAACKCNYDENQWLHLITEAVAATEGGRRLPEVLSAAPDSDAAAAAQARMTALVQQRRCDREAKAFADTSVALDLAQLDQLANVCIPGHVFLSMLCVHNFLLQGETEPAMLWLQTMQHLLAPVEQCMDSESPFPVRVAELKAWAQHWSTNPIPEEAQGGALVLSVGFQGAIALRPTTNRALQHCLPLKDPDCFPPGTANANEACHSCCDQDQHGPEGNVQCWEGPYTFQRCCHDRDSTPPAAEAAAGQPQPPAPPPKPPVPPVAEPRGCDKAELCKEEAQLSQKLGKQLEDQGATLQEQVKLLEDVADRSKESLKAAEDYKGQLEKAGADLQHCQQSVDEFTKRLDDKDAEVGESVGDCKTKLTDKDARAKMLERAKEAEAKKAKKFEELSESLKLELEESRKETAAAQEEAAAAKAEAAKQAAIAAAEAKKAAEQKARAEGLEVQLKESQQATAKAQEAEKKSAAEAVKQAAAAAASAKQAKEAEAARAEATKEAAASKAEAAKATKEAEASNAKATKEADAAAKAAKLAKDAETAKAEAVKEAAASKAEVAKESGEKQKFKAQAEKSTIDIEKLKGDVEVAAAARKNAEDGLKTLQAKTHGSLTDIATAAIAAMSGPQKK